MLACPPSGSLIFFFYPNNGFDGNEINTENTDVVPMDTTADHWDLKRASKASPMKVDPSSPQPNQSPNLEENERLEEAELASLYARQFFGYDFKHPNHSQSVPSTSPDSFVRASINESGLASFFNHRVASVLGAASKRLEEIQKETR